MTYRLSVNFPSFFLHVKWAVQSPAKLIVVGSAALDISARPIADELTLHSTSPGSISMSFGGVGRNVAEACHRVLTSRSQELVSATLLISPAGSDPLGRMLIEEIEKLGLRTDGMFHRNESTAVCSMILDSKGSLIRGVADMSITEALDGGLVRFFASQSALPC